MHVQDGILHDIEHIAQPYWYQNGGTLSKDDFGLKTAQALEEIILEIGKNRVAAFIAEPIQGAGGVIIPPDSYWPEIQRICKKYGILLVADEVICGFDRLGEWFGSDHFNIEADLMPIGRLIMRAVGDSMIICPPLVISNSEIDELVDKAKLCLDLTLEEIQS